MDPLSVSASVITIIAFSGGCAKLLRSVIRNANHAPDEILALSNEISDLNLLLSDLEATSDAIEQARDPETHTSVSSGISDQLGKARSILVHLESLVPELFTTLPGGRLKFQRYRWMRKKSLVLRLQQDLAKIKRYLGLLLASATASRTVRIELSLQAMRVEQLGNPDSSASSIQLQSDDQHSSQAAVEELDEENGPHTPPASSPSDSAGNGPPGPQTETPNTISILPSTWGSEDSASTVLQTVRQIAQFGTMTLHLHRVVRCNGHCECICHSRGGIHSPQFLNRLLGHLFIGYAGLPVWTRDCNTGSCTNQYARAVQVSYTFPGWLLSRTVDIVAATTYTNEPQFGLKVRNRVQNTDNSVFSLARNGNLPGIKRLFEERRTSPNDLNAATGHTALHVRSLLRRFRARLVIYSSFSMKFAIESANQFGIETAKFLLDMVRMDPHFKDDFGMSVAHEVSGLMLANTRTTRAWDYDTIFSRISGDHSELWDFSHIHNIVVGIHHADLDAALLNPKYRGLLDSYDANGRTPLFWAALRGDTRKVSSLLAAGADHSKTDFERRSPLHAALRSGSLSCVEALLRRGSNVHARDRFSHTALKIAAWADDNEAILEALYMAGASINDADKYGSSSLASAACLNHLQNAKWFLSKGANIESVDTDGFSPLLEAVKYCNTDMVELLLSRGAKVDLTTTCGQSVLHVLASTGNRESAEVLTRFPLQGLSCETRDSSNRTAWEILESRVGSPEGMRDAFLRLLNHIEALNNDESDDGDSDVDVVFADALESLDVS